MARGRCLIEVTRNSCRHCMMAMCRAAEMAICQDNESPSGVFALAASWGCAEAL